MKLLKVTLSLIVLLSSNAFAAVKLLESNDKTMLLNVTEQYTLGDNDTLTSAEGVAIEQVKRSATNYAGSYVESVLVVQDSNITTEQVKILSAGFMEVLDSNFKRTINKSGSVVLSTDATVRISMESIRDGLAKLKNDSGRKKQIDALQQKNDRLQKQLIELTRKINSSTVTRADLMKSREEVLSSLNNNRESAKKVFEKGTLLEMANLDSDNITIAKIDLYENALGYIKNEIKVKLGDIEVVENRKKKYDIYVEYEWVLPNEEPLIEVLNKYFNLRIMERKGRYYLVAERSDRKNKHSDKLLNHLDFYAHVMIKSEHDGSRNSRNYQRYAIGSDFGSFSLRIINATNKKKLTLDNIKIGSKDKFMFSDYSKEELESISGFDIKTIMKLRD